MLYIATINVQIVHCIVQLLQYHSWSVVYYGIVRLHTIIVNSTNHKVELHPNDVYGVSLNTSTEKSEQLRGDTDSTNNIKATPNEVYGISEEYQKQQDNDMWHLGNDPNESNYYYITLEDSTYATIGNSHDQIHGDRYVTKEGQSI